MARRAKVFMNNRSQAVRLPKEFQFNTDEVFIRKEGEEVIQSPRPRIGRMIGANGLLHRRSRAYARASPRHEQHGRVRPRERAHSRELDAARPSPSFER